MSTIIRKYKFWMVLSAVAGLIVCVDQMRCDAQIASPQPLYVRFTGSLYPVDTKPESLGGDSLRVFIEDKKTPMLFKVQSLTDLNRTVTQMDIMLTLSPYDTYIRGPKNMIDSIRSGSLTGKTISLEGYLYANQRILRVETMTDASQQQ